MARMRCNITTKLTKQRLQSNLDTQVSAKRNMQELLATAFEALSASRRLFQELQEHKASKSAYTWNYIDRQAQHDSHTETTGLVQRGGVLNNHL